MYNKEKLNYLLDNTNECILFERTQKYANMSERDEEILYNIGIPSATAPFVNFTLQKDRKIYPLSKYVNIDSFAFEDEEDKIEQSRLLDIYLAIGFIGNGDYIVINDENQVILVNHEDLSEMYINYSLEDFMNCLYDYQFFMNQIYDRGTDEDELSELMNAEDIEALKEKLLELDEFSLDDDSFWKDEIDMLCEEIE